MLIHFSIFILAAKTSLCFTDYRRIVALGDIHGDYGQAVANLVMAGLIHPVSHDWVARDTVFVQTGDIVDRGDDTIAVYALMRTLEMQAKKFNSEVHILLGTPLKLFSQHILN